MGVRVGLVGVGAMGASLMSRLQLAGHAVQAYDISEARRQFARDQGAETVGSVAEAARDVDFIHLFVRTDAEVIEAAIGPGGVLSSAKPGALLFLHSTVMPESSRKIAAVVAPKGLRTIDAPVTAVPRVVAEGNAVFLIGGEAADAAIATPHLQALGRAVHHFGPVGSGNVAKLAKNLINAAERVALSEVAAIAEAGGLDVQQFLAMAAAIDRGSTVARWETIFAFEGNHAAPRPSSNLYEKDVMLAARLARDLGVHAPMTQAAAETAKGWVEGWGKVSA